MVGALAGKVLGFAREIEMARLLGAGYVVDSFRASITATMLPIAMMQGDLVPSVLIPMHRKWCEDGNAPLRFALLTTMFGLTSVAILALCWVMADAWIGLLVAGFNPQQHALTVQFFRIMALSMPASVLANCFSCVEISLGRSRVSTIRASVQNIAVILAIFVMASTGDVLLLGWAFTASMTVTAMYGGVMLVVERELTFCGATMAEAKLVAVSFVRRVRIFLLQPLADQLNILLERFLVSGVGVGALSSIDYARSLSETATYLISQPIGSVVLAQTALDSEGTRVRAESLLRPLFALALPAAAFVFVFAPDIVSLALRRGEFQEHAVFLTSAALRGISVGLWATTIGWVLIRMLNAAGRNRVAIGVMIVASVGQALMNLATVRQIGVMGVGLGESIRGVVILIGATFALQVGGLLLRLLLTSVIPLLALIALGLGVRQIFETSLMRILVGAVVFGIGAAPSLMFLAPEFSRALMQRFPGVGTASKAMRSFTRRRLPGPVP